MAVGDAQICAVLAGSVQDAWDHLVADPTVIESRKRAIWVPGSHEAILASSPVLQRRSALRRGRPITVRTPTEWGKVPRTGGIYRIYRYDSEVSDRLEVYIGRSSNLRRRPGRHEQIGDRPWGRFPDGIDHVDLIPARELAVDSVWSSVDLDEAEELHIRLAKERELQGGPRVINRTVGRNGPPSRANVHTFIWEAHVPNGAGR